MNSIEHLVYMANQIGRNLEALGHDHAVAATADHIASFWDPRMKRLIFERLEAGDPALSDIARAAVTCLRDRGAPAPQSGATEFAAVDQPGGSDAG